MNKLDFTDYKFRCSSLGKLMVGTKKGLTPKQHELLDSLQEKNQSGKITDKQIITLGELLDKKPAKPTLSQTTKSYLEKLHKEEVFDKRTEIQSKYLNKGIQVEEKAITLYSEVTNQLFLKNKVRKSDSFKTGEADNAQGKIRDIKSVWSLDTFPLYEDKITNKDYYWQLQGYMSLWGFSHAELIYCLVDTPELLIEDEKRRTSWKLGYVELPEVLANEIEMNMTFKNIPNELKCKVFKIEHNDDDIRDLHAQIRICRNYLNFLSDKMSSYITEPQQLLAV